MTFGEKLRELRDLAGLSEAKLAELSGVSFGAVHNYSLGFRRPTFAAAVKLARALGVTCEAFADCDDVAGELATEDTPAEPPAERPNGRPRRAPDSGEGKKPRARKAKG
jgi:transcriptional regulator with XRE-family HTH domain